MDLLLLRIPVIILRIICSSSWADDSSVFVVTCHLKSRDITESFFGPVRTRPVRPNINIGRVILYWPDERVYYTCCKLYWSCERIIILAIFLIMQIKIFKLYPCKMRKITYLLLGRFYCYFRQWYDSIASIGPITRSTQKSSRNDIIYTTILDIARQRMQCQWRSNLNCWNEQGTEENFKQIRS